MIIPEDNNEIKSHKSVLNIASVVTKPVSIYMEFIYSLVGHAPLISTDLITKTIDNKIIEIGIYIKAY